MQACRQLRGFCRVHEWAGGTAALLGVGLLLGTIWVGIDYQIGIRAWVATNPLPHGLAFGTLTLVDVLLIYGGVSRNPRKFRHSNSSPTTPP